MNAIRSILAHVDGSAHADDRLRVAHQLAEAFAADAMAVYCVTPALQRFPLAADAGAEWLQPLYEADTECRDRARRAFDAIAIAGGTVRRMSWMEETGDAPWGFVRRALYRDLLVLGQGDPHDPAGNQVPGDFVARVVVESGRPALVLPCARPAVPIGEVVLVAWKETPEAARAVSSAMPWLVRARQVHAVCCGERAVGALDGLRSYLHAHGVEVSLHQGDADDVGCTLLAMAAALGADLLVLGCYGHGRAREWVLGGVTRTVLRTMTLPVLIAH